MFELILVQSARQKLLTTFVQDLPVGWRLYANQIFRLGSHDAPWTLGPIGQTVRFKVEDKASWPSTVTAVAGTILVGEGKEVKTAGRGIIPLALGQGTKTMRETGAPPPTTAVVLSIQDEEWEELPSPFIITATVDAAKIRMPTRRF